MNKASHKPIANQHPLDQVDAFRHSLGSWFDLNACDYPWRRTSDPYAVWVSEVMLQQTRISTVLSKDYFGRFLEAFSDVGALASAGDEPLLKAWEGLGYYRRARMMRTTAQAVMERHAGEFPADLAALLALPGIGRYTAGAIRAFAFGLPAVLLDGNGIRVLSRLLDFQQHVDQPKPLAQLWDWAAQLADDLHPRRYHAALMELGQSHCRAGQPNCPACPVAAFCQTRTPEQLPKKTPKLPPTQITEHALWVFRPDGQLLLHLESGSRRTGLWKLPLRTADEVASFPVLGTLSYSITRYRVTLRIYDASDTANTVILQPGDTWVDLSDWSSLPLAAPFRRAITQLGC
jgi:A/G-specific adenine glycosylase